MVAEWLSSWLAEQEDRGLIPSLATWIFRDWLSPASKSRYGWKIAKSTLILKQPAKPSHCIWEMPLKRIWSRWGKYNVCRWPCYCHICAKLTAHLQWRQAWSTVHVDITVSVCPFQHKYDGNMVIFGRVYISGVNYAVTSRRLWESWVTTWLFFRCI